jgi:acetyl-CoA synthetase
MVWNLFKRLRGSRAEAQKSTRSTPVIESASGPVVGVKPLEQRVRALVSLYDNPQASAAYLLCDQYPADAVAYRVIDADLTAENITYGDLRTRSEQLATGLASLGIGPGDRVATLMGKSVEYLVTLMAIWRIGGVHVPLFTAFAPPAIAFRLSGSNAKVVMTDDAQQHKLAASDDIPSSPPFRIVTTATAQRLPEGAVRFDDLIKSNVSSFPAAQLGGNAPMIQIYTSGTTGRPKGVIVPIKALANFHAYAEFGLGLRPDDMFWCAADPGWGYGLYFGVLAAFTTGTPSLFLKGGFDPQVTFDVMKRFGVTNFAAAPTVYRAMRTANLCSSAEINLRCASSAGEPLTPEVNEWAVGALGLEVHDHFGQTEAGMLVNNHHHPALKRPIKEGSMGSRLPGWHVLVLKANEDTPAAPGELGRVAVEIPKSPFHWFTGYLNDPEKSAEKFAGSGRYYLTGDTGKMDEDGYFYFKSRDDDVIIMAGYRIGPFEVESVLSTHPVVGECAVIASPDSIRGEVLEAFVVLRPGQAASRELESDLQQWVKTRYAAHAYPRRVNFIDALPKTPSGKVQRFVLRQRRIDELDRSKP